MTTSTGCATPLCNVARAVDVVDGAPCHIVDHALADADLARLGAAVDATRLLGHSQLVGGFAATRGFGIACHHDALDDALQKAPFLRAFVDLALQPTLRALIRPPSVVDRLGSLLFHDINALYLNVLSVPPGACVQRHTDATLGTVVDDDRALVPRVVVALYVAVPHDLQGGVLRLFRGVDEAPIAEIEPRVGRLVAFDGRLAHEVTATTASGPRISCVAELYRLPRTRLRRLPRIRLQSNGFADVLQRVQGSR